MIRLQSTIDMTTPSRKHREYVGRSDGKHISIAEGAIRSGKTIDNCYIASRYLRTCEDRLHLATGSTVRNAKLNIGDCNGFGLEYLFKGRCRWGKYRDNEALFIQTGAGEKIVIFAGGGKADSYKGILGNSYGLWIATEINEHHIDINEPKHSFVHVAMGRQLAAHNYKILWDLNPSNPNADIYTKLIDPYTEQGIANYQHFTLFDNSSLTQEQIGDTLKRYIEGTIQHTRDILGKRCVAEGLIYKAFVDNAERHLTKSPSFDFIQVGVDFGGSKSAFAFVACGLKHDYSTLTALCSERWPAKGLTPEDMYRLLETFLARVKRDYGQISTIYADSAEQTLINGMRGRLGVPVRNSIKNEINDRINAFASIVARGAFFYTEDCETLVAAISTAIYDPKKFEDVRLDNGTSDIDTLDAFEYSWERYIAKFIRWGE